MNLPLDTSKALDPIAYSYARFSLLIQGKGDSLNRQTKGPQEWSEKTGIPIVESMNDLGLSAYKNHHVKKGELGAFLELCKSERMKEITQARDVFLLVESLDRLSRRKIMEAVTQLAAIVDAGVIVVTLQDGMIHTQETMNTLQGLIISIAVMSRANEESNVKANRVTEGWVGKWDKVRETIKAGGNALVTKRVPFCFKVKKDGVSLEVIPEAAAILRRIFQMVADGETYSGTARTLNREQVPHAGSFCNWKTKNPSKSWSSQVVKKLINSEWPIGHLVTPKGRIDNYFPAIVDEAIWAKARKQALHLKTLNQGKPGRQGGKPGYNIFTHIARDSQTGEGMQVRAWPNGSHVMRRYLLPASVRYGRRKGASWYLPQFEDLFFTTVRLALNVDRNMDQEEHELTLTTKELQVVQAKLENLADAIAGDPDLDLPVIKKRLEDYGSQEKALLEKEQVLREKLMAGNSLTLDPEETDRETLRMAVRSNVKVIHINNDAKSFEVELQNGITYKVTTLKSGEVLVTSPDFETPEAIKMHSKGGAKGWGKARDLSVRRERHGELATKT